MILGTKRSSDSGAAVFTRRVSGYAHLDRKRSLSDAEFGVRPFGVFFVLAACWWVGVMVRALLSDDGDPVVWSSAIAATGLITVHLLLSVRRYSWLSVQGLLVGVAFFYAVPVRESVVWFGLAEVPSGYSLSERGIILSSACVVVYLISMAIGMRLVRPPKDVRGHREAAGVAPAVSGQVFLGVGVLGFLIAFPSLDSLQGAWAGEASAEIASGPFAYMLTATRAFLPLGTALVLLPWAQRSRGRAAITLLMTSLVGLLALSTFSLNRAVFVLPAIAALLTVISRGWRVSFRTIGVSAIGVAVLFFAFGIYRESLNNPGVVLDLGELLLETIQIYGQVSHNVGVPFDYPGAFSVGTIAAGLLSPLPGAGSPFRDSSGTAIYNDLLYGSGVVDQILPIWGEAWAVGGFALIVGLGCSVGAIAEGLSQKSNMARGIPVSFAVNWAAVWMVLSVFYSTSNIVQGLIYMVIPIGVVGAVLQIPSRSSQHGKSRNSATSVRRPASSSRLSVGGGSRRR